MRWGRRVAAIGVVAACVFGIVGCVPEPAPTPTPTGFANEAEAFAAAEATYRAYVDALNQVDLSDPDTFEAVYAWTTGDANAAERQAFSTMHAEAWRATGSTYAAVVEPGPTRLPDSIELLVCQDVGEVDITNANGESQVESSRPDIQSMIVELVPSQDTSTGWIIATFQGRDGAPFCG